MERDAEGRLLVVADSSFLINFLVLDRIDILAALRQFRFHVLDHVVAEIRYEEQRQRLEAAVGQGIVAPHPEGGWQVKAPGADRASSRHETQGEAEARAKEIVSNLGGGEVTIQNRRGRIRDSDTVSPGNDPNPPRDRRH